MSSFKSTNELVSINLKNSEIIFRSLNPKSDIIILFFLFRDCEIKTLFRIKIVKKTVK